MRSKMLVALVLTTALAVFSPLEEVKNTVEALKNAVGNKPRIRALILERMDLAEMGSRESFSELLRKLRERIRELDK